ncbi:MAG: F0F1 ATP synthase subunit B [Candidatus Saccharimonadales bacterium]
MFTQFGAAEQTSGIGALGISGSHLVVQLITFVLAYLVLRKFAFGPILKVLAERRDTIEKGVKLGEQMQKERAELDKTVTAELHKARQEADTILAEAGDNAKSTVRAAEDTARTKAAGIVKEAEANADQAVKRARKALESELIGLISEATEAIIDEKVDARKDAALIDKALAGQKA